MSHEPPAGAATPARAARVAGGYELVNGSLRVVISDRTGDVLFFGSDAGRNVVPHGVVARLAGLPDVPPTGTVEARDDQTWQFFGTDANGVTWRKIYCLQDDALLVSVVVTNGLTKPLPATVRLIGEMPSFQAHQHDPEHLLATAPGWYADLRGYNEFPAPGEWPPAGVLLRSDHFTLKPGERQGYTTRWRLAPLDGNPQQG